MDRKFKVLKINHVAVAVSNNNNALSLFSLLGMNYEDSQFIEKNGQA